MTPERWKEIKFIVENALECPEIERSAFIEQACGQDLDMRKEVNSILYFHGEMGEFLEKPIVPGFNDGEKNNFVNKSLILNQGAILQQRYLILEKIGQGGMGAVYKAQDKRLNNLVALKQIIVSGDRLEKAFEQEAQLLAKLRHPSLPRVIDYFNEDNCQFLVMEFINGETLSQLLAKRGKPFEMSQIISWTEQLLEALNYLHSHNPSIVHRDIKPHNLKLTKQNQIVLLDFGLAKGLRKNSSASISNIESSIAGYTPHYAPLEQIDGLGTDCRSDIYSVAATIYHLATYHKPADATSRAIATLNKEPDPLKLAHFLNNNISLAFTQLLNECLAQNINQRPTSAKTLLLRLRNLQNSTNNASLNIQNNETLDSSEIETLVATNQIKQTANKKTSDRVDDKIGFIPIKINKNTSYLMIGIIGLFLIAITGMVTKNLANLSPGFIAKPPQINQAKSDSKQTTNQSNLQTNKLNNTLDVKDVKHFGEPDFKGDPISVDIRGVELYDLLRFCSDNYGLNFVVDESVPKMIVTMKVNDVPWGDALASVLDTNNLTYRIENNVVRIVPKHNPFTPKPSSINKKSEEKKQKIKS